MFPNKDWACSGLNHWGRVMHICVSKLSIIGSDNGLSPGRRQAIIWTNAGILLIWTLGTNFNEMLIEIHIFSVKKMHLKMSSAKWRPFCLGLNVLMIPCLLYFHEYGNISTLNIKIPCAVGGVMNRIWWLCLVPTSTTRFASAVRYRMAKFIAEFNRLIQGKYF